MTSVMLWSTLTTKGVAVGKTIRLTGQRTMAGEQSLTIEHCSSDPRYIITYRTYSSSHDSEGTYRVVLTWKIILLFSENLGYIIEKTTYDNDVPVLHISRIKIAMAIGDFGLPAHTRRATDKELYEVWADIKTRGRV